MNPQLGRKPENASRIRNAVIVGASIFLVLGVCFFFCPRGPYYAGRPVSAWFDDLCRYSGIPNNRFDAAYEAFTKMDSNAVPYLVSQLKYDRSGVIQRMLLLSRRSPILANFATGLIFPSTQRSYAALALGRMGPKAVSAVPALLETWVQDKTGAKDGALGALHSILFDEAGKPYSPSEQKELEAKVIAEAIRRYPVEVAKLGIKSQ